MILTVAPDAWIRRSLLALALVSPAGVLASEAPAALAKRIQTPYASPKVVFDVYLDDPAKMGAALYWVRSFMNPLIEPPYSLFNEDMQVKVLIHGTEIVTLARHNEAKYADVVQRMRYYADQGVDFLVCGLALQDYGYTVADMQPFVTVTPSAITELVHWQNRGFALVTPQVTEKRLSIESIR